MDKRNTSTELVTTKPGFVLTHKAESDLKSIGRYTQNTWGVRQRNNYLSAIDKGFHALAATPWKDKITGQYGMAIANIK